MSGAFPIEKWILMRALDISGIAFGTQNEKNLIYVESDKPPDLVEKFKREKESGLLIEGQVKLEWKKLI